MLGAQGYLLKSAIESGKIQFMVIPQNGNVSIPVPSRPRPTTQPTTPLSPMTALPSHLELVQGVVLPKPVGADPVLDFLNTRSEWTARGAGPERVADVVRGAS